MLLKETLEVIRLLQDTYCHVPVRKTGISTSTLQTYVVTISLLSQPDNTVGFGSVQ